jgi:hypothetical protein
MCPGYCFSKQPEAAAACEGSGGAAASRLAVDPCGDACGR